MTRKEKLIEDTKQEIVKLQEKLKSLETLPEFDENERLLDINDFPRLGLHINKLVFGGKIDTVFDLVNASPEYILRIHGIGKSYLDQVMEWMDKHGLTFVD